MRENKSFENALRIYANKYKNNKIKIENKRASDMSNSESNRLEIEGCPFSIARKNLNIYRKAKLKQAGITLIALVVTIVVLLILAGVSMSLILGNNGIINKTADAASKTEIEQEKEKVEFVSANLAIEKIQYGEDVSVTKFQEMVDNEFGKNKATGAKETDSYTITVEKSGNVYQIEDKGESVLVGNKDELVADSNPGVLEGDGTESNPYKINSIEDLVAFSYNVNVLGTTYNGKTVSLGRSLYFNGSFNSYANPDSKYAKVTNGYTPSTTATTTIKELMTTDDGFISIGKSSPAFEGDFDGKNHFLANIKTKDDGGLFENRFTGWTIKNLGIESGTFGGIIKLFQASEGLLVENCYNKANIASGGSSGNSGGILGMTTNETANVVIKNCYNEGTISVKNSFTGGIVGYIRGTATIIDCHNTGILNGDNQCGGIVGYVQKTLTITNCYNTMNISRNNSIIGGIVGNVGTLIVSNCYNTGIMGENTSSCYDIGGIVGYVRESLTATDCYNSGKISGNSLMGGIAGCVEKTSTITICYNTGDITGNIKNSTQIGGIIGQAGTLTIMNCYNKGNIINGYTNIGGIAGCLSGSINNCYNEGNIINGNDNIGGIAGLGQTTLTITECNNTGEISGDTNVGGITGKSYGGNIDKCYNTGKISGKYQISGIVGVLSGMVSNCYNTGKINGGDSPTGGIIANGGKAINCYNTGEISGNNNVGGIMGYGTTATNCYNSGIIVSNGNYSPTGGIIGQGSEAINCYNKGDVTGDNVSGGIIGSGTTTTNCYNIGNIIGRYQVGGIIGSGGNCKATECYNSGNIGPTTSALFEIANGTLTNAYYQIKATNANTTNCTGLTETEMNKKMALTNFLSILNQKVQENNADSTNTQLKKWKIDNNTLMFE